MPGQHSDEERERKERIKKMKIKTSKMRLAINLPSGKKVKFTRNSDVENIGGDGGLATNETIKELKDFLNKSKSSALKKKKKEYDQDGENEHNRDNYNAQSSVETGGDY